MRLIYWRTGPSDFGSDPFDGFDKLTVVSLSNHKLRTSIFKQTPPVGILLFITNHVIIISMNSITIPQKLAKEGDLVVIPRKEYEALLELRRVKEFIPTRVQKRALMQAERNFKQKKALSYNELVKKLGFTN
ncbi:hypothetical protein A2833_01065 [Candidatus Azambacteria bacterium RIFCSPHIGHO2_01_FULL_44_55]|nr:MAG: hypothetical protein A3C78_03340 [Candidatus Azambacteria bacterium RIFCSPHIGHO2_02_FULL_45_18]OGD41808.1 MAG: hypothetical protein A2833_01065 [Candidatus Azambacteria bacterium RIFCSPHIGHO2_01_FULL_44_55]OGD52030.1 MAG: hypothetical protein A2608_00020 [Candidatus Azambacteria bacterium RIFOXYD1_FULL_44_10]